MYDYAGWYNPCPPCPTCSVPKCPVCGVAFRGPLQRPDGAWIFGHEDSDFCIYFGEWTT